MPGKRSLKGKGSYLKYKNEDRKYKNKVRKIIKHLMKFKKNNGIDRMEVLKEWAEKNKFNIEAGTKV